MIALCVAVLAFSFAGSAHCAGMCGAFVAFAIGVGDPAVKISHTALLALYQFGRLVTYMLLGVAAGALGSGLDLTGRHLGIGQTAAVAAGSLMVGFGMITLLRIYGFRIKGLATPKLLTSVITACHGRAMRYSPPVRALATGLLTTLLPCGFLWAGVIIAAGTGHALFGAAVMATFWLGTLPVMSLVGVGIRALSAPLAAKLPAVTASAIVIVGLYTIVARANVTLPALKKANPSTAALVRQVESIDTDTLPCCVKPAATQPSTPGEDRP
jgi:sulfite exporter TauE/SafE